MPKPEDHPKQADPDADGTEGVEIEWGADEGVEEGAVEYEEDITPEELRRMEETFEADNVEDAADPMAVLRGETPESAQFLGSEGLGIPATVDPTARAARIRRHKVQQGKAQSAQFKAFMGPLLLIVGAILVLMGGGVALYLGGSADDGEVLIRGEVLGVPVATLIGYGSLVVGPVLLLGAWLFHRDVKKANRTGR